MNKRKFKRIRKLNILGVKHSVKYIKTDSDNGYYSQGLIEINKDILDKDEFIRVLIHEGFHGVFQITGIHQDISLPQEHCIIDSAISFLMANFHIEIKN
jgi:hypothetical protein